MATNRSSDTVTLMQNCRSQPNATVTLVVPTNGTIVLTSQVTAIVFHVNGNVDMWTVMHGNAPTDCSGLFDGWVGYVSGSQPTEGLTVTATVVSYYRAGPGAHTFYLTGLENSAPPNTVMITRSKTVAVFYPDS